MLHSSVQAEEANSLLSPGWQQLQFLPTQTISLFLLGDLTLCLVCLLLIFHFSQKLLVHPLRPPDFTAWFPAHWDRQFLSREEASLKISHLYWTTHLSEAICSWRRFMKSALLKYRVVMLFSFCSLLWRSWTPSFHGHCSWGHPQPPHL